MPTETTAPTTAPPPGGDERAPRTWLRILLTIVCVGFAAFWIWALFFASKESINRIGDATWAERAEAVCDAAHLEREELADFERGDSGDAEALGRRATLVDQATDILDQMVDDINAVRPDDPKGQELVPQWVDDYRTYLANRRAYTDELRAGNNVDFYETAVDGIPISERLQRFAVDNDMGSCAPPSDMVLVSS